jgi:hypothetical protein
VKDACKGFDLLVACKGLSPFTLPRKIISHRLPTAEPHSKSDITEWKHSMRGMPLQTLLEKRPKPYLCNLNQLT